MAVFSLEATYNAAVDSAITALKNAYDNQSLSPTVARSAGDYIYFTPCDRGNGANPDTRSTLAASVVPTFSTVVVREQIDDGDFDIVVPGPNGIMYPLFWKLTNQARDLT